MTLDLPSVTYLFQVFIFGFLWKESESDGPLILKSLSKIGKANKVERTKPLNCYNMQLVLQLVSWEGKVKSNLKIRATFLQVTHCPLLKLSSNSISSVVELGYIYDFFSTLEINLILPFFLKYL